MSDRQDIVLSVASQTLFFDVPEGRPSSVTGVAVYGWNEGDGGTAESATTGSAAVDAVNTTFDADSGDGQSNPRLANLAATTNIVALREYYATDSEGRSEWIIPAGITSGASLEAVHPMGLDYSSGDTFVGTRISISVLDSWAADESKLSTGLYAFDEYRVRWIYVVNSVTYRRTTTFSLVRMAGDHTTNPGDLDKRFPGILNIMPTDYRDARAQILMDKAHGEFREDLIDLTIPDELIIDRETVNMFTEYKSAVLIARSKVLLGDDPQMLVVAKEAYGERLAARFGAPSRIKVPVGTDSTGAGNLRAPARISQR